jgi:hypothetical protein
VPVARRPRELRSTLIEPTPAVVARSAEPVGTA